MKTSRVTWTTAPGGNRPNAHNRNQRGEAFSISGPLSACKAVARKLPGIKLQKIEGNRARIYGGNPAQMRVALREAIEAANGTDS